MSQYTKEQKLKLLRYAELSWASYSTGLNEGMFGDKEKKWGLNKQKNYLNEIEAKQNNQTTYKKALTNGIISFYDDTRVEFTNKQAKVFINRYEVVAFVDKKDSGFSATLFYDIQEGEIILAFRGLDIFRLNIFEIPNFEGLGNSLRADVPLEICNDMFNFYNKNIKILNKQVIAVGHSFGGYLAQLFALSYPSAIKEVYTFSAPGVVADWSNSIVNYILPITFAPNPNSYVFIEVKQEHKDSTSFQDGLIYISKDNKELDSFIPYYLKAKSPYASNHIDSYVRSGSPLPEKTSMGKFARFLYEQIKVAENGQLLACNFQTDINAISMIMHDERGVIPMDKKYKEELIILSKRLKNADKILPSPLTQDKIHSIQTDIEKIYRFNLEKNYTFFGKHILSIEYKIPIDKKLKLEISPFSIKHLFTKESILNFKSFFTKENLFKKGKVVAKESVIASLVGYVLVFVSIKDIYEALLVISHIDEAVLNDCNIIDFFEELHETPSLLG